MVIETVTVGNPGNAGELSGAGAGGIGPDRICGAVDYVYSIGKYMVTAGQYTEFLNAVAAEDTYWLYNENMWSDGYGCKIRRVGSPGGYTYLVDADGNDVEDADWVDRPVNYVDFCDMARFCNWLHSGQPTGAQDLNTTEDGSYYLNGTCDPSTDVRKPGATWVIPSEDEWYKAAYHYNNGVTGDYFDYPTSNDGVPSNDLIDPDPGNNATFFIDPDDYTIGPPYYRTEGGAHEHSGSPYGTFDQAGNLWELNETIIGSGRGIRGGWFGLPYPNAMHAAYRYTGIPGGSGMNSGMRVAKVSEQPVPAVSEWGMVTMALLVLTLGTLVWARRGAATA